MKLLFWNKTKVLESLDTQMYNIIYHYKCKFIVNSLQHGLDFLECVNVNFKKNTCGKKKILFVICYFINAKYGKHKNIL